MMNLELIRVTAEGIALRAGAALRRTFGGQHEETIKSSMADIVTEGDKASEAVIVSLLRAAFPDHGIVSEEGDIGDAPSTYSVAWHVDPIDGTTNFSKNMPHYNVSIALADADLNPLVAVVYAPFLNELFSAARGMGATLNGNPIHVSAVDQLAQAVVVTGLAATRKIPDNWQRVITINQQVRAIRVHGAAALDLCFVAMGRCEALWMSRIHSWDLLAGALIVEEAGGRVSDFSGKPGKVAYSGVEILASNGAVHEQMLESLRDSSDA